MTLAESNPQMANAQARWEAIRRLQLAHWDEWQFILCEERERVGLPRERGPEAIKNENLKLRQRIAQLESGQK